MLLRSVPRDFPRPCPSPGTWAATTLRTTTQIAPLTRQLPSHNSQLFYCTPLRWPPQPAPPQIVVFSCRQVYWLLPGKPMTVCGVAIRFGIPLTRGISVEILLNSHCLGNLAFIGIINSLMAFLRHLVETLSGKGPDPRTGARSFPGPAEGPEPESTIPGLIQWCFTP